jgi:uncharacterized protein YcbK (DUF882 family)
MYLTRREFLRYSSTALLVTSCVSSALASTTEQRTLSFVHTHTGEKLTAPYVQDGCHQPDCLAQVNRFLRDFRTGEVHPIDPTLLDVLFDLRTLADHDEAFQIISGYRSAATNSQLRRKSAGVAKRSLHMDGKALDIRLTGFPTRKLRDLALSLQRGGVGFYATSDFLHVDTGRIRSW